MARASSMAAAVLGLAGVAAAATAQERACTECHTPTTHAWGRSLHARAADDPVFLAEHERRRDPWCLACHDPRGGGRGIDCVVCHVRDGSVVSTAASGHAPHVTVVDPSMGTVAACARCHDFDFPRVPGQPMQDTVDEWHASAPGRRGEPCQRCHMPPVRGGHDHATPGGRDPALLARALDVRVRAWPSGRTTRVELVLASLAGHAVPTGDLFRHLVVTAEADETSATVVLGRRFLPRDGQLHERADDRVPASGTRRVALELPAVATRVSWSVELRAMTEARAEQADLPADAWRAFVASGEVDVARAAPRAARAGQ